MIDIKDIRTRYSEIEKNIETRYMNVDLAKIAADMEKRSELLQNAEALRPQSAHRRGQGYKGSACCC